jgi:hypothetical protein
MPFNQRSSQKRTKSQEIVRNGKELELSIDLSASNSQALLSPSHPDKIEENEEKVIHFTSKIKRLLVIHF